MRSTGRPQGPVGEIFEDELGNLYEWVEGVDGLGNPIGFWKQIKTAGRAVGRRLKSAVRHGVYCGFGDKCPSGVDCPARDRMDECCRQHDICYARNGVEFHTRNLPWVRHKSLPCDRAFCACLSRTSPGSARAAAYRAGAQAIFCPRPRSPLNPLPI